LDNSTNTGVRLERIIAELYIVAKLKNPIILE